MSEKRVELNIIYPVHSFYSYVFNKQKYYLYAFELKTKNKTFAKIGISRAINARISAIESSDIKIKRLLFLESTHSEFAAKILEKILHFRLASLRYARKINATLYGYHDFIVNNIKSPIPCGMSEIFQISLEELMIYYGENKINMREAICARNKECCLAAPILSSCCKSSDKDIDFFDSFKIVQY